MRAPCCIKLQSDGVVARSVVGEVSERGAFEQ